MENIDFQKANKKRLEVLQKGYNANTKVIEKYLDKLQDLLSEMSDDEDVQLIDLYRVLSVTIARITTATYHKSEAEFQQETQVAHQQVNRFFKEYLKQGSPEANQEDFKVSRLMMFTADLIDAIMWNYFIGIQSEEVMDLNNYLAEEAAENEK